MTIQELRIAVLIPTRGDRKKLYFHCIGMLDKQTINPFYIEIMNYESESEQKDITQRYKRGYNYLSEYSKLNHIDLIAFIEDDDYYSPTYLEIMATEWLRAGQPDIMGTGKTIYYHLKLRKYFTMHHPSRSSAMNTLIKPNLQLTWPEDNYAFTDLHLWNMTQFRQQTLPAGNQLPKSMWLRGHIFNPDKIISIGMKHGFGLTGGRCHTDRLERFNIDDSDMRFLHDNCDKESFEFYSNLFK